MNRTGVIYMSEKVPSISEAEWEVMNVLWEKAPQTANDVISNLQGQKDWKSKTVRTLLDRLVHKDVVGVNKDQRVYTFYPLYSQDDCQRAEAESFIKRIYGGTVKSMLVQFMEEDSLSEEDIEELKSILDEKPKKEKNNLNRDLMKGLNDAQITILSRQISKKILEGEVLKEELFTKRLALRKIRISDATALFNVWSDPAVAAFMNISAFIHESQAIEMINLLNELAETNQAIRYTLFDLKSKDIIGSCGFNAIDTENARVEIGYDIAKAHWGNGYAPESIQALIDEAFDNLAINRIEAKVEPANINSIKVLQKLGFTFEGTLRQYEKVKGNFVDMHMYSLLKKMINYMEAVPDLFQNLERFFFRVFHFKKQIKKVRTFFICFLLNFFN